jgi:hypothetical protein
VPIAAGDVGERERHVAPGVQVVEERVVLKEVAAAAALRLKVDALLCVEPGV